MPARPLDLRNIALPLLFASVMTIIAGASSTQRREAAEGEAAPPQDTVVVNSIGDLPTSTRFKSNASWGGPLNEHHSEGPEFTLTKPTTITEIGAYVESCWANGGEYVERCQPIPSITVDIHPQLNGKPDINTVIASYTLSNDEDRTLISYESVKVKLRLEPGTYYAIFNNPSNYGIILGGIPNKGDCFSAAMAYVRKDPDSVFTSRQCLGVRILKEAN